MPSKLTKIKNVSFDDMFDESSKSEEESTPIATNIIKSNAEFKNERDKQEKETLNPNLRAQLWDSIPYKAPRAYKPITVSLSLEAINKLDAIAANKRITRSRIVEWLITGKGVNDRSADMDVKSSIIEQHKNYVESKKNKRG